MSQNQYHKTRNPFIQSNLKQIHEAQENLREQAWFWFTTDWQRKRQEVMQKPRLTQITFENRSIQYSQLAYQAYLLA